MKLEKVSKIIKECTKHNLSPNEYFLLYCLYKGEKMPGNVNEVHYKINLFGKGLLNNKYELTEKSLSIFEFSECDREKIEKYRLMWPSLILPSGKNARSSYKDLEGRFVWFLENFDYDWDTIYTATEEYIKYYNQRGYNFMRTSSFFIYKESTPKFRTSDLAEWCDKVLNEDIKEESFDIDI